LKILIKNLFKTKLNRSGYWNIGAWPPSLNWTNHAPGILSVIMIELAEGMKLLFPFPMFFSRSTRFIYFTFKNSYFVIQKWKFSRCWRWFINYKATKTDTNLSFRISYPYPLNVAVSSQSLVVIIPCPSTYVTFLPAGIVQNVPSIVISNIFELSFFYHRMLNLVFLCI